MKNSLHVGSFDSSFEENEWQEEVVVEHQVNMSIYLPMLLLMSMLISNIERRNIHQYHRIILLGILFSSSSIVGDDDGGKLFTPDEYDEYKRRVLPMV